MGERLRNLLGIKPARSRSGEDVVKFLIQCNRPLHVLEMEALGCRTPDIKAALDKGLIEQIPKGQIGYPNYRLVKR